MYNVYCLFEVEQLNGFGAVHCVTYFTKECSLSTTMSVYATWGVRDVPLYRLCSFSIVFFTSVLHPLPSPQLYDFKEILHNLQSRTSLNHPLLRLLVMWVPNVSLPANLRFLEIFTMHDL